jgi:hypothetical protein
MCIAVIGGVVTSTLLTLWVVPVVFVWVERARARLRRRPPPGLEDEDELPLDARRPPAPRGTIAGT